MVRLKDGDSRRHSHTDSISIPYGSIKRGRRGSRPFRASAFQFLMVRLKDALYDIRICKAI